MPPEPATNDVRVASACAGARGQPASRAVRRPNIEGEPMMNKSWRSLATVLALAAAPLIGTVASAPPAAALNNGLALTPQMGFNDWNAFGCNVSESLIKSTADKIVSSGMAAAGYQYVNIDDCWLQGSRDSSGNLQPDFAKFPDGISGTAAYVHSK